MSNPTVCYVGLYPQSQLARNGVLARGLDLEGIKVIECVDGRPGLRKFFAVANKFLAVKKEVDLVLVGFTSGIYAPLMRLISSKPIIFNAAHSMYEGIVEDRKDYAKFSPAAWYYWFLDVISFTFSDLVLVETQEQQEYLTRSFLVPTRKMCVLYAGADDQIFYPDTTVPKYETFTVAFRGGLLPATGTRYVVEAALLLKDEPIDFVIYGRGPEEKLLRSLAGDSPHIRFVTEFLAWDELRRSLAKAHLLCGQFSSHPRLDRTIQNKTFEALALGMTLVTRDSRSNRELLTDGTDVVFVPPQDPAALAARIKELAANDSERERIGRNARVLYERTSTPSVVAKKFLQITSEYVER